MVITLKSHVDVKRAQGTTIRLCLINWRPRHHLSNLCLFVANKNIPFPVKSGFPMEGDHSCERL